MNIFMEYTLPKAILLRTSGNTFLEEKKKRKEEHSEKKGRFSATGSLNKVYILLNTHF